MSNKIAANPARQALVLASTSKYRKILLMRLGLPFTTAAPDIDESPLAAETPSQLVARLAVAKARAVAGRFPKALIIGSDQVAVLNGVIMGKPQDHHDAVKQLSAASGRQVKLYTGLCLYNAASDKVQCSVEEYRVTYRALSTAQIERYLAKDQPYDCAGSLKAESLGIALLHSLSGDDPSTLMGLPLIRLTDMLTAQNSAPI